MCCSWKKQKYSPHWLEGLLLENWTWWLLIPIHVLNRTLLSKLVISWNQAFSSDFISIMSDRKNMWSDTIVIGCNSASSSATWTVLKSSMKRIVEETKELISESQVVNRFASSNRLIYLQSRHHTETWQGAPCTAGVGFGLVSGHYHKDSSVGEEDGDALAACELIYTRIWVFVEVIQQGRRIISVTNT